MIELDHLSYSSISMYQLCTRSWRFRYVEKAVGPVSAAALFGTAMHQTIETLIRDRYEGRISNPQQLWVRTWEEQTTGCTSEIIWNGTTFAMYREDGIQMINHPDTIAFIRNFQPAVDAEGPMIERRMELRVPGVPLPVIGYVDLIAEDGVPLDLKTSSRAWSAAKAAGETQPLFYLAALNQAGWSKLSYRFRHVVLVRSRPPRVQVFESGRQIDEIFHLLETIRQIWRAIESGAFPTNYQCWKCSPQWCEYWLACRGKQ